MKHIAIFLFMILLLGAIIYFVYLVFIKDVSEWTISTWDRSSLRVYDGTWVWDEESVIDYSQYTTWHSDGLFGRKHDGAETIYAISKLNPDYVVVFYGFGGYKSDADYAFKVATIDGALPLLDKAFTDSEHRNVTRTTPDGQYVTTKYLGIGTSSDGIEYEAEVYTENQTLMLILTTDSLIQRSCTNGVTISPPYLDEIFESDGDKRKEIQIPKEILQGFLTKARHTGILIDKACFEVPIEDVLLDVRLMDTLRLEEDVNVKEVKKLEDMLNFEAKLSIDDVLRLRQAY